MITALHAPPDLEAQHPHLVRIFTNLAAQALRGDSILCDGTWDAATGALLHHMHEEDALLDRLDPLLPEHDLMLGVLRDEHVQIRHRLAELGPLVQLHVASPGMLGDLVSLLQAHAAREEKTLYRWLEQLPPEQLAEPVSAVGPGTAIGASVGAIAGEVAGPVGMLGGALLGAVIGAATGKGLDKMPT